MKTTKNARFWAFVNGDFVKITLRPGQSLDWGRCDDTEEGWSNECIKWDYADDEGAVYREAVSGGRDCDGEIQHSSQAVCPVADLATGNAVTTENSPTWQADAIKSVTYPKWETLSRETYDQYAQMAGY